MQMPRLCVGSGSLKSLLDTFKQYQTTSVMIITCQDLVTHGVYGRLSGILALWTGIKTVCYDRIEPDPTLETVEEIVAIGRREKIDLIIALGGGSPIDAAKVAAALIPTQQSVRDVIGIGRVKDALPLIAIPTTAGTGSEVTPVAILTDTVDQVKKAVVSELMIPRLAILDADLTLALPKQQTAFTGLDALSHAIEAFTSKNATPLTDFYAREAISLMQRYLRPAYNDGTDRDARTSMQLGAYYAGIAFANAGVTAAHAFAYPLGARYHLPHGLAVILMLPAVLEYNQVGQETRFDELARLLNADQAATHADLVPALVTLCQDLDIPLGLSHSKVQPDDLKPMAESVLTITRILNNNPRPITQLAEAESIFQRAFLYA
jgi:alcohol dehydrogenase class IV